jgi:hypothetical protein
MEELKNAESANEADAVEAVDAPADGRRFRLSKRTLVIAGVVLLVLVLIVSGILVYQANARQKAAAAEKVLVEKRERAQREEAEKLEAAAAQALAEKSRKAHTEIMTASPLAASLPPPPVKDVAAPAAAQATPGGEGVKPATAATAEKPQATAMPAPASADSSNKEAAKKVPEIAAPGAAGGCTLSSGSPEDYGKALGRCLEEFNRLEGRKK